MTIPLIPWSPAFADWHRDPALVRWLRDLASQGAIYRHLWHTRRPGGGAPGPARLSDPCEVFTARSRLTNQEQLEAATDLGFDLWVCISWMKGNGRRRADGEPETATGWGRYWSGATEGWVRQAVEALIGLPVHIRSRIKIAQMENEPLRGHAQAIRGFIQSYGGILRGQGWRIAGSDDPTHLDAYADLTDIIDCHPLWASPEQLRAYIAQKRRDFPRHQLLASELVPDKIQNAAAYWSEADRLDGVGVFSGNLRDFSQAEPLWWNFKERQRFNAWAAEGLTHVGRVYTESRGLSPDDYKLNGGEPEPIPPPPDDTYPGQKSVEKVREVSQEGVGERWSRNSNKVVQKRMDRIEGLLKS